MCILGSAKCDEEPEERLQQLEIAPGAASFTSNVDQMSQVLWGRKKPSAPLHRLKRSGCAFASTQPQLDGSFQLEP